MNDPLSDRIGSEHDPYGISRTRTALSRLVRTGHPDAVAAAIESFLKRLALLEMVLEEMEVELAEDRLISFLERNHNEVDAETYKLAQLLFGRVATREGG
ncbi:MAG: hypothetical protein MAG453_00377 [Calditrichaeota bacterium]|nr:hypothetical protein [Calditrichota bacterium]